RLEETERDRERRREALLLAGLAEVAHGRAEDILHRRGVERARGEGRLDLLAELLDLLLARAELLRLGELRLVALALAGAEREREVGRGDDVGAGARRRELVELEARDGGVDRGPPEPGARAERDVRARAAHRAHPAHGLEDRARRLLGER